jgi:DNA repair photolyase
MDSANDTDQIKEQSNPAAEQAPPPPSQALDLKIVEWDRRTDVLGRPTLPCLEHYHTLNLTAGCPNECHYCYAQSYTYRPERGTVAFYSNMLGRLREELPRMRQRPRLVFFSSASEPFLPVDRILHDLYDIMKLLLESGSELLISTKGVVQERFAELFGRYPGKVRVQVGITTLDDTIRETLEPRAATVEQRLANLELLLKYGVGVEARLDPLVPGLTDTPESLTPLIDELARRGVKRASASFLFLRTGVKLPADLAWGRWTAKEMKRLYTEKVDDFCSGGKITLPSPLYRRARYNDIKAQAALRGLAVRLCRCKNADMTEDCCLGDLPETEKFGQMTLF